MPSIIPVADAGRAGELTGDSGLEACSYGTASIEAEWSALETIHLLNYLQL